MKEIVLKTNKCNSKTTIKGNFTLSILESIKL